MAPYPGEHFDPTGLPPAGPHPVFPPQCGECSALNVSLKLTLKFHLKFSLKCEFGQVWRKAETTSRHLRTPGSERAELTRLRFLITLTPLS